MRYCFPVHELRSHRTRRGAFATVHLCTSKKDGKQYAVKIIQKKPSQLESIEAELKIMTMVNHENIIHVYDLFQTSTHIYMVLEL